MTLPALAAAGVGKHFGQQSVLQSVTLQVAAGESVALAGLNGAGKSTLLRCLLGFLRPDRGEIRVAGHLAGSAAASQTLAYLPERFQAPAYATGFEFLQLAASLHGVPWQREAAVACSASLALGAADLARPVARLSKGSSQKLGLVACLLSRRSLYILDEPLSGLDIEARALAIGLLQGLRQAGHSLLFTCHEPADIETLSDRMALLHQGRILFDGPAALLREAQQVARLDDAVTRALRAARPAQGSLA